jgi:hypothetical protein
MYRFVCLLLIAGLLAVVIAVSVSATEPQYVVTITAPGCAPIILRGHPGGSEAEDWTLPPIPDSNSALIAINLELHRLEAKKAGLLLFSDPTSLSGYRALHWSLLGVPTFMQVPMSIRNFP